jgi:hypothetical protein
LHYAFQNLYSDTTFLRPTNTAAPVCPVERGHLPPLQRSAHSGLTAASETPVMNSDSNRQRAEKGFRRDSRKTMTEYELRAREIREKTERLKALRLAKEAQERNSKRDK